MGHSTGRRGARESGRRSIARAGNRRKAPRIVSTPHPFTGVRSTRSRLVRTPRKIGLPTNTGSGAKDRRATGVSEDWVASTSNHGKPPTERRAPRRHGERSGRSEMAVVKRHRLQFLLRDESRGGSGNGEPSARVQVVRWKRWQKSAGRIAALRRKTVARPSSKESSRAHC